MVCSMVWIFLPNETQLCVCEPYYVSDVVTQIGRHISIFISRSHRVHSNFLMVGSELTAVMNVRVIGEV